MLASPIIWKGGKAQLRAEILSLMETVPHTRYVEPFVGAAWVLLGKYPVGCEVINDLDGGLINFFQVLADPKWHAQLQERFEYLALHSTALYDSWNAHHPAHLHPVERALRWLYLNRVTWRAATVSDEPGGGPGVGFDRDGGAPSLWDTTLKRCKEVSLRLRRVHIEQRDAIECLQRHDSPDTLFYLDPPYLDRTGYNHAFGYAEHERLLATLVGLKGRFLLSHTDHDYWRGTAAAEGWSLREVVANRCLGEGRAAGKADELLIANFNLYPVRQARFM